MKLVPVDKKHTTTYRPYNCKSRQAKGLLTHFWRISTTKLLFIMNSQSDRTVWTTSFSRLELFTLQFKTGSSSQNSYITCFESLLCICIISSNKLPNPSLNTTTAVPKKSAWMQNRDGQCKPQISMSWKSEPCVSTGKCTSPLMDGLSWHFSFFRSFCIPRLAFHQSYEKKYYVIKNPKF